ncbi:MAG: type I 3-dehydroquinate dehydratase [Gemmiger sp.]|nr:type I 3-dehydroquinate dehydratase [Gemmiger sp.]
MSITLRGVALGTPAEKLRAKVIVPIFATTQATAVATAAALARNPAAELVELRLDALAATSPTAMAACLLAVRAALPATPLLATVRTLAQGGGLALDAAGYADVFTALCATGGADLMDLEFDPAHPGLALPLAAAAKNAGMVTVFSHHDFAATPPVAEMLALLTAMAAAGADVAKLAVMPHTAADAAALLQATAQAGAALPATPLITMSMGPLGAVTRVCGGAFGCCATFGTAGVASAPGQPDAAALAAALKSLENCL